MESVQSFRTRRRAYVKNHGRRVLQAIDRYLGHASLVGDHPFFDKDLFPYNRTLEENWKTIRTELEQILEHREHIPPFHQISPDQSRISTGDHWLTFILYGFGHRSERNCQQCPRTTRVLETIPRLKSAWFSILAPGYHIPPHRGVTKGVVRTHLGLIIPREREACRIRVGDQTRRWEEGKCLVLDDTFEHEVWNETDEQRVVLIIDVERPLSLPARLLNRLMLRAVQLTAYVQDARRNLSSWEERFESAVQRADSYHMETDATADRPQPGR
jgi:ornithine lipid ester-linked acyl 2-hydroxylase